MTEATLLSDSNAHTETADSHLTPCDYYQTYIGHRIEHLTCMLAALRARGQPVVFLAGDSTLDNKHWLFGPGQKSNPDTYTSNDDICADAIGGYRNVLVPPRMVKDVAYWIAQQGEEDQAFVAINTSVEESVLGGRATSLRLQDEFIRDNVTGNDVIVMSAGGNDVALRPTRETQQAMMKLMCGQAEEAMAYFVDLFKTQMSAYASALVAKAKPRAIICCMLYYLDESSDGGGFADSTLRALGYNDNPSFLQDVMKHVFEVAIKEVQIEGTRVVPLPLFNILDGKDPRDYIARVEPSVAGGHKLGLALGNTIRGLLASSEADP